MAMRLQELQKVIDGKALAASEADDGLGESRLDVISGIGIIFVGEGVGTRIVWASAERLDLDAMAVDQLAPEVAEEVLGARRLLFVSACLGGGSVRLERVRPAAHQGWLHLSGQGFARADARRLRQGVGVLGCSLSP